MESQSDGGLPRVERHQFGVREDMTGERSFQFGTLRATGQSEYLVERENTEEIAMRPRRWTGAAIPDIAKIIRALHPASRNALFADLRDSRINIPRPANA